MKAVINKIGVVLLVAGIVTLVVGLVASITVGTVAVKVCLISSILLNGVGISMMRFDGIHIDRGDGKKK